MKTIYALGVGHNTPVFIELAEACGYFVKGLYHYTEGRTGEYDHGFEILGSFDDLFSKQDLSGMNFLLTMGDSRIRCSLSEKIRIKGGNVPSIIDPTAVISRFASISETGVYISPFTYVQADASIGENTVLLDHVNINHTTNIGKGCFIAGGCTIGAYTRVEDFVFFGQGALSISGKVQVIGEGAYIGARTLVTKSVPKNALLVGSPGKVYKIIGNKND